MYHHEAYHEVGPEYLDQLSEIKGVDLEKSLSEFVKHRQEMRPEMLPENNPIIEARSPLEQHPLTDLEAVLAWEEIYNRPELTPLEYDKTDLEQWEALYNQQGSFSDENAE